MKIKYLIKEKGISLADLRWVGKLISPYKGKIICMILLQCFLSAVGVGSAVVHKYLVDYAARYLNVTGLIVLAAACSCVSLLGSIFLNVYSVRITERFSFHIRSSLYAHILNSLWIERTRLHSGEILSRLTSDVNRIADGVINVSAGIASTLVQFVLAFVLLWQYDRMLAVFALMTGPFVAVFGFAMGRRLKRIQVDLQQTEADYRVFLQEQISHADILKVFQQEAESQQKLRCIQEKRMGLVIKSNRCSVLMRFGISAFFSASYLFAFITGALKVASGAITYGTMTAFLSLVNQVQTPVLSLSRVVSQLIGVMASASRVRRITDLPQEKLLPGKTRAGSAVGVSVSKVTFSYDGEHNVIHDLSFEIAPGSITAIMGSSGIGKTTLVRLMLGFLKPAAGEIRFVSQTEQFLCSEATRSLLSYVPQGNTLFSGTIAENLRIGNRDASEKEMWEALEAACAAEFVARLPMGLHTRIGEKSHGISEGQAQRISIARAILRPAPILILDEATSSLDEETERNILHHLTRRRPEQTRIVISHRDAITKFANQIIHL